MTEPRRLEEYGPFMVERGAELDLGRLRKLHDTVRKYRDSFFTDLDLQDALMNGGYRPEHEDKRPTSYFDLSDMVVPRTQTLLHLLTVQHAISIVTRPQLIVAPTPTLWLPGQPAPDERWKLPGGGDAERLENLQRQWFDETETRGRVQRYEEALEEAFGEFNLKFVLTRMYHAKHHAQSPIRRARTFQQEMQHVLFPQGYTVLDSAYYNEARRKFSAAGPLWEELNKTEFGKFFLLSQDEVAEGMHQYMSPH